MAHKNYSWKREGASQIPDDLVRGTRPQLSQQKVRQIIPFQREHLALPAVGRFEKEITENALISIGCSFILLATRFFVPPIVLYYVPIEVYGLWAYCFVLINYFGISVIGITNVYVRYSAIFLAHKDYSKINRLLSTGLACTALLSLIATIILWEFLPLLFPVIHVPENQYSTAFALLFGTFAIFSFGLTVSAFKFLLHGLQKVGLQWIFHTICHILETGLIIVFLVFGNGILSLLYAYIFQVLLSSLIYAIACFHYLPSLSIRMRHFDPSMLQIFFGFGGIIQVRSVLGIISRSLTRLLSGMFMGTQATALYDLGEKFPATVTSIPSTGLFVSLPASSHLHAKGEMQRITSLYLYGSRYMSIISGLMLGFLTPFSWMLVTFWLGPDPQYKTAALILACFAIPYHIVIVTGPASSAFRSINLPGRELIYGICELGFSVAAVSASFYFFGYSIMAINTGIGSMFVLTSLAYLFYTNYYLHIPQQDFLKKVLVPGFFPYLFASLLALGTLPWYDAITSDRWNAFYALFPSWCLYTAIITPLYYFFVLEKRERQHLREHYFERFLLPAKRFRKKSSTHLQATRKTQLVWQLCQPLSQRTINE